MFVIVSRVILLCLMLALSGLPLRLSAETPPAVPAPGQSVTLHWGIREGLPHNVIKAIVQTPDGYLWLGTQEGLVRFDGFHFTNFTTRNAPGLVSNNIYDLKLDRSGTLWIHANMAVSCYRRGVFTDVSARVLHNTRIIKIGIGGDGRFFGVGDQLYRDNGRSLAPDAAFATIAGRRTDCQAGTDGTFWVGTDQGDLYEMRGDQAIRRATAAQLGKGNVGVACGPSGAVWITGAKGLFRLRGGTLTHVPATAPTNGFTFAGGNDTGSPAIVCDGAGDVWGFDGTTLFLYRSGRFVSLSHAPGAPVPCTRIGLDAAGHFFALGPVPAKPALPKAAVRLYRYDSGRFSRLTITNGILPLWAFPVCRDRDNNLWVGTMQGLEFHHAALARTYATQDGLPAAGAGALCAGADGSVWMGTQAEGLWREVRGRFQRVPAAGLPHAQISGLARDPAGDLWISAGGDTYRWRDGRLTPFSKLYPVPGKPVPTVYSVAWGPAGVWAAETSRGLLHLVDGHYRYTDTALNPVLLNTSCRLYIDRQSRVWVMGTIGFSCFDGDRVTNFGPDQGLARTPVIAVCESHDGALWFCLWGGGIARWKNGRMTAITYRDGLYSDMIYGIVEDDYGSLWIGSGPGIFRVSLADMNRAADGRSKTITCRPYGLADGVTGGEVVPDLQSAGCKDKSGQIWFSGMEGLARIDPRPLPPVVQPVLIESVAIDGVPYPQMQGVVAPPGHGQIEVQYTTINDTTPERIQFRYKLVGYDDDWVEAGSRHIAFYTKLPPGSYTLLVQAKGDEGRWNNEATRITLTLQPHFYQTPWFTALRYAALALLILVVVRARLRRIKAYSRELEWKVAERTQLLEQAHEEVLAQNQQMQDMQAELEAQNQELLDSQTELAAQNEEMQQIREDLRIKNMVLTASNARLADLATTDGLTGLRNHRSFQERLEQEWTLAARYERPLSVLLMDVDQFKQYNDSYGHPAGDEVLRRVGQTLLECARDTDFVARYGGEEFVVILPQTDLAGACALAERYRAAIAAVSWPHRAVTVSIGAAASNPAAHTQAALLEQADEALYQSKARGRNRVTPWEKQNVLAA